jgi:hypothetical protein
MVEGHSRAISHQDRLAERFYSCIETSTFCASECLDLMEENLEAGTIFDWYITE